MGLLGGINQVLLHHEGAGKGAGSGAEAEADGPACADLASHPERKGKEADRRTTATSKSVT